MTKRAGKERLGQVSGCRVVEANDFGSRDDDAVVGALLFNS